MQATSKQIKAYIALLQDELGCTLKIYDDYRLLDCDETLASLCEIRRWHSNAYCMQIKQSPYLHGKCISLKRRFWEKVARSDGAVTSTCFAGVCEVAVAVRLAQRPVIVLSAIGYLGELPKPMLALLSRRTNLAPTQLQDLRENALRPNTVRDVEKISTHLEALACLLQSFLATKEAELCQKLPQSSHAEPPLYIKQALAFLDECFMLDIGVPNVAAACGVSVSHLQHAFLRELGHGVGEELRRRRIAYACELLRDPQKSVREIALKCGFRNVDYFSAAFHRTCGLTPLAYRCRVNGR